MSNRVKRDVRLEVAPGALGVTFEADYNGCAGKFFQQTNNRHDQSLSVFQLSPPLPLINPVLFSPGNAFSRHQTICNDTGWS